MQNNNITDNQKDVNQWHGFLLFLAFVLIIGTGLYFTYQLQKVNTRIDKIETKEEIK